MATTIGSTGSSGSPVIKIKVAGVLGDGAEFDATVDTGFSAFISMPIMNALPLGLTLYGTTSVQFGDGNSAARFTALATATISGEPGPQVGVVILEPATTETLVGMSFITSFKKSVFFYRGFIALFDESEMDQIMKKAFEHAGLLSPETPPEKPA